MFEENIMLDKKLLTKHLSHFLYQLNKCSWISQEDNEFMTRLTKSMICGILLIVPDEGDDECSDDEGSIAEGAGPNGNG